jgi:7-cyano-7-deazaguanine synthase
MDPLNATVLMSGGLDSAACAQLLREQGFSVQGIFVDYGQAAGARELSAATALARHLQIDLTQISVVGLSASSAGELVGRNSMLLFLVLFAGSGQPGLIALGIHAGSNYFDCSDHFLKEIRRLVSEHTDGRVSIVAPFIDWSKREIFDYACSKGLPVELTYSCETGSTPVCGICASCRDRKALGC